LLVAIWPAVAPTDPDYWWHERTGQLIAETHAVPTVDPYSFTAAGQPWVAHEWLTELFFYAIQSHVAYVGNVVLLGLLGAASVVMLFATCRLWGIGDLTAVVLVVWAFGMSLPSFGVRPQSITRVLLTLLALLLTRYRRDADWRWLLPLSPLFLAWVNLHGGFAIGLGLLGLTLVGSFLETRSIRAVRPLVLVTFVSVALTFVNPSGAAGALYPLAFVSQSTGGQQLISEWQPPDFRQLAFAPFWLSLLLATVIGVWGRPLRLVEVMWVLAFAVLALQSIRNIQLYATVVLPLIGARLRNLAPAFGREVRDWRNPRRLAVLWIFVSIVSAAGLLARAPSLQLGAEPDASQFPVGGAAYLRENHLRGNLFNQFEWGGYLIYADFPEQRVYLDGRPDMYGNALFDEYVSVVNLHPGWQQVLDRRAIQLVLVDRDGPLSTALEREPGWAELYTGPVERLFSRLAPAPGQS
jgi:hypothetical protein